MNTRAWFRVHSFTGVITGLLLFVVCWSGTFATVSYELDWLVTPERRVAVVEGSPASWGDLYAAAAAHQSDGTVDSLHAPLYPNAVLVAWTKTPAGSRRLYINPYTADVQGEQSGFDVARFFRSFHMHLFMPGSVGYYVVGATGLTLLVSLCAALFLYKRWWLRFFRFRTGSVRVVLAELHKTAGLWSLWFLLLIAVTGIWYLFETAAYDIAGDTLTYRPDPAFSEPAGTRPLDELVTVVRAARPDLGIQTVRFPGPGEGQANSVYFDGQDVHFLVRDRANKIYVSRHSGEVLFDQSASDLTAYWRWIDTADPLHFGNFGGLFTKLIWFVFGLGLSGIVLTGTYLHARRIRANEASANRHRWDGTLSAVLVTLAIVASTAYFGFAQARDYYGVRIDGKMTFPDLPLGVDVFLATWILTTTLIVAFWAWLLLRPSPKRMKRKPESRILEASEVSAK